MSVIKINYLACKVGKMIHKQKIYQLIEIDSKMTKMIDLIENDFQAAIMN